MSSSIQIDLAKKQDLPSKFTSAEMTEIKNAISTETANVKIQTNHIYSTDEKEVGVTEDGELIYEKTKKGLSVSVTTTDSWQEIDTITGSKALYSVTLYSDGGNGTLVIVTPREVMINNSQKLFIKGVIGSNRTISRYTVQYTKTQS